MAPIRDPPFAPPPPPSVSAFPLLSLPDTILAQVATSVIPSDSFPASSPSSCWSWPPHQLVTFALCCRRTYAVTEPLRHRVISASSYVQRKRILESSLPPLLPPEFAHGSGNVPLYFWGPYLVTSLGHFYEHGRRVALQDTWALEVCLANADDIAHVPVPALESFSHQCAADWEDGPSSAAPLPKGAASEPTNGKQSTKHPPPPSSSAPPTAIVNPLGLSPAAVDTLLTGILSQTSAGRLRHLRLIAVPLPKRWILSSLATWHGRASLVSLELDPRTPVPTLDLSLVQLPNLRRFMLRCRMMCQTKVLGLPFMPQCEEMLIQAHEMAIKVCSQVRLLHRLSRLTLTLYSKHTRFHTLPKCLSHLPAGLKDLSLYTANGDNLLDATRPLPNLTSLTVSYYADPNPWILGPHDTTLWSPGIPLLCGTKFPLVSKLRVALGVVTPGLVCTLASLPSLKALEFGAHVRPLVLSESVVMSGTGDGRWPALGWVERVEGPADVVDFLIAHVDMPRLKSITYKSPIPFAPTTAFVALFNAASPETDPTSASSTSAPSAGVPLTPTNAANALLQAAASLTACQSSALATSASPAGGSSKLSSALASYQQHSAAATLANAAGYGYYKLTPTQQRASAVALAELCKVHGFPHAAPLPIESILTTPNGGVSFAYSTKPMSGGGGAGAGKGKKSGGGGGAGGGVSEPSAGYEAMVTSMLVSLIPGATEDVGRGGAAALNRKAREIAAAAAAGEFVKGHVCNETCLSYKNGGLAKGGGGTGDREIGVSQLRGPGAGKTVTSLPTAAPPSATAHPNMGGFSTSSLPQMALPTGSSAQGLPRRRKSGCLGLCCAGSGDPQGLDLKAMVNALIHSSPTAAVTAAGPTRSAASMSNATAELVHSFTSEFLAQYSLPKDATYLPSGAAATAAKPVQRAFKRLDTLDVSDLPHARVSRARVLDLPLGAHLVAHPRQLAWLFSAGGGGVPKLTKLTLISGTPLANAIHLDPRVHLPFLEHLTLGRTLPAVGAYDREACRGLGCRTRAAHDWDHWDLLEWELAYAAVEEGKGPFATLVHPGVPPRGDGASVVKNAFGVPMGPLDPHDRVKRIRLEPGLRAIEWITRLPALKKVSVQQPLVVVVGPLAEAVTLTVANRESSGVWAALAKYVEYVRPKGARGVGAVRIVAGPKLTNGFAASTQQQSSLKAMWQREPGFQQLVDKLAFGVDQWVGGPEAHALGLALTNRRLPRGSRVVHATSYGASAVVEGRPHLSVAAMIQYPETRLCLADSVQSPVPTSTATVADTMATLVRADSGVDQSALDGSACCSTIKGKTAGVTGDSLGDGRVGTCENGHVRAAI